MSPIAASPTEYRSATGSPGYDHISWSAPPISKLVAIDHQGVQAIRHLGSLAKGTMQTRSRGALRPDALLLARRSGGTFEARVGGGFKSSSLERDLCCYLPHGADADLEYPTFSQGLILHFSPGFLARHFDPSDAVSLDPALGFRNAALANVMEMIEQELASPGFGHDLYLEGLYRYVAAALARTSLPPSRVTPDRLHISPFKLNRVFDYIEAHLADKITTKDLADVAGISMFHFCRVFKKTVNESPYQYVRSRRLLRARTLMESERHSLADISLRCGFANQAHFTSAFVRETGMPPGRFRRALQLDS